MLVSDLPLSAVPVPAGGWTDPTTRTRYFVDPLDPTLLVSRPWNEAEVADYNQHAAVRDGNEKATRTEASDAVDELLELIGPPAAEATAGENTINGLLSFTNADINANPAKFIKAGLRLLRRIVKMIIPALRLIAGRLESTSTGN